MGTWCQGLSTLYFVDSGTITGKQNVYRAIYTKIMYLLMLRGKCIFRFHHYSKYPVSLFPTSSLCCFGFVDYNQ